jgi:integrase
MGRRRDHRIRSARKAAYPKAHREDKDRSQRALKEMVRDLDDGLAIGPKNYTVTEAVRYWLRYGLNGRSEGTVANYTYLAEGHIVPGLGARKLRELSAEDVDRWLATESKKSSTRTLRLLHSILNRAVQKAQARDKVKRNVVMLCDVPTGIEGRPSKSLNLEQAEAVLKTAEQSRAHAYIVLSLLIGARTEELRALKWEEVDLDGQPDADPPVPPSMAVYRSVTHGRECQVR